MSQQLLTPKYLTKEIAKQAVDLAFEAVFGHHSPVRPRLRRDHCHVVVLVPAMDDAREADYPDYPNYPLQPVVLYEDGLGEKEKWDKEFDNIARCKALQLWTDRNDDRTSPIPHLLFPGDTPYWGGVKRRGIVVTCSGLQPYFDKLVSGLVADIIVALAHDAYENDEEVKQGVDFVS